MDPQYFTDLTCSQCVKSELLGFDFSFAFQPIVSLQQQAVVSYEALVRGPNGEPAADVFTHVKPPNLYRFDQACRVKAIRLAAKLGLSVNLNVNFFPNAVYRPELCIRTTIEAATTYNFPVEKIVFEVTEGENVKDHAHLRHIIQTYQKLGFTTAIDDFGAGYSGLNLLAEYQPNCIKLDRAIISEIHQSRPKQAIIRGVHLFCRELNIELLAEGVETADEYEWLRGEGLDLFQGYYFGRPAFESLPEVDRAVL